MNLPVWSIILATVVLAIFARFPLGLWYYQVVQKSCDRTNRLSFASDPGYVELSERKLRRLCPGLYASRWNLLGKIDERMGWRAAERLSCADQLVHGDSRAAVVVSTSPLLVAAYTDELDCVALLRFPDGLATEMGLDVGSRLLTVNRYVPRGPFARDLENGPASHHRYKNFIPIIADFLSDDAERLTLRKSRIDEEEWERTWMLGQRSLKQHGAAARDGRPHRCIMPAIMVTRKALISAAAKGDPTLCNPDSIA